MIPQTMRALQLQRPGRLDEVEIPVPVPEPDEVLIRTRATAICTADIIDINQNPFGIPLPRVLGHEGAGDIIAIGEQVRGFDIGQQVVAHPVIPCGQCAACKRELEHLCEQMGHLAFDHDGTFAEYFCAPARRLHPVPENMDLVMASLMEPVATCIEALERARVQEHDIVLVVGDGAFGIIISRLAFAYKPERVILVGRHDFRLAQVPEALRINESRSDDIVRAVQAVSSGHGIDVAILAVGTASALDLCLRSLRTRGRLAIFSALTRPVPIDLFRVHVKELELLGACNDENYVDRALEHLADPERHLDRLVTHRLPFDDWQHAIELATFAKDEALKVVMTFSDETE